MSMTLKQAYTNWSMAPRNLVLSAKYREGVNQVLMKKYSDTELSEITREFATDIMRNSPAARQLKVQAASALVFTLQWGGDHGHCPRPSFAFNDIVPADKPASTGSAPARPKIKVVEVPEELETQLKEDEESDSDKAQRVEKPLGSAGDGKKNGEKRSDKDPSVKEKKARTKKGGRPPRAVVQIDPETLNIVKKWPVMAYVGDAMNIGKGNVIRAVKKHQKAAGFFWCYAEESEKYIEELKKKMPSRRVSPTTVEQHPDRPKSDVEKMSDEQEAPAMSPNVMKEKYEAFNKTRPVQPKETKPQEDEKPEPSLDVEPDTPDQEKEGVQDVSHHPEQHAQAEPASKTSITVFTDEELFTELDRRGWVGCFSRTEIVTIGNKT